MKKLIVGLFLFAVLAVASSSLVFTHSNGLSATGNTSEPDAVSTLQL